MVSAKRVNRNFKRKATWAEAMKDVVLALKQLLNEIISSTLYKKGIQVNQIIHCVASPKAPAECE